MDTQTKITLVTQFPSRESKKDFFLNEFPENSEVFSISEYGNHKLIFTTNLLNAFIKIETYASEKLIEIKNGCEVVLSEHLKSNSLVPGTYRFQYFDGFHSKIFNFHMTSDSIELDHLQNIKKSLENFIPNLSRNLLNSKRNNSFYKLGTNNKYESYEYISLHYEEFIYTLNSIMKDPLVELEKEYKNCRFSKKPDAKTFKNYSKKGMSIYETFEKEYIHLEKRTFLNIDIPENRWLYQTLDSLNIIFSEFILELNIEKKNYNLKIDNILSELKSYNDEYKKIQGKSYLVGEVVLFDLKKRIALLKKNINHLEKVNNKIEEYSKKATIKNQLINSFLHSDFFNSVTNRRKLVKNLKKIVKHKKYGWLYNFIENINSFNSSRKNSEIKYFTAQPTWLLFEYYSVFLCVQVFLELGFSWESGWLKEDKSKLSIGGLEGNTEIIFRKENFEVVLAYDKEIKVIKNKEQSGFDSRSTTNRSGVILF